MIDGTGGIGQAHVAHQVAVHGFDVAAHGALIAAQAGSLDGNEVACGDQWVGVLPGLRRALRQCRRVSLWRLATARNDCTAKGHGDQFESLDHPLSP